jgi:hypothetical protein
MSEYRRFLDELEHITRDRGLPCMQDEIVVIATTATVKLGEMIVDVVLTARIHALAQERGDVHDAKIDSIRLYFDQSVRRRRIDRSH